MKLPPVFVALLALGAATLLAATPVVERPRPLMRDFIGLNGHTVQFRPELYAPVALQIRDYHPLRWDLGEDTASATRFPFAQNGVDWALVYGSWKKAGQHVHASLMFDDIAPSAWKDLSKDPAVYGAAFAKAFGPGSPTPLVDSVEIGNEPGKYSDAEYRRLFEAMAGGLRKADPKLRIAPCAVNLGPSGRYSKSVDLLQGLEAFYDILNVHIYAEVEGWPTWRRSYPEDPKIPFLEHLNAVLTWRRQSAPDKEIWLTEFGFDASTKPAPATGTFAKWEGSTEIQQARWIVRTWLLTAALGFDRAYLYFFNDDDTPHVHGSSGLTRNFVPKPAYYAAAWLQKNLGDYRFSKVLRQDATEGFLYEFDHQSEPGRKILALWKPAGPAIVAKVPLLAGQQCERVERMPLGAGMPDTVQGRLHAEGFLELEAGESPVLLWVTSKP